MIKAKSVLAVVALATGVSALAAPLASAAEPSGPYVSVPDLLDDLGTSALPAERRHEVPTVTYQLSQLHKLGELHKVTDLVQPVTGLVPAFQ
ncbi:hypothetical protein [Streptomyces sp. H27-C3]|uniref:hypothetical protein n=1 Tax=Streptomyces sp. H27-C3 TaxID=3046305 RepID=UPI0024B9DDE6|nr:hypothetical protein [Streptomyces sp. H27-C3]MDJ0464015.1 hypothetical protein [Streptomyces sp. H27-C3]